jgi:hypothetical protein
LLVRLLSGWYFVDVASDHVPFSVPSRAHIARVTIGTDAGFALNHRIARNCLDAGS